eukprot:3429353-Amphidinium_carterae.1
MGLSAVTSLVADSKKRCGILVAWEQNQECMDPPLATSASVANSFSKNKALAKFQGSNYNIVASKLPFQNKC